MTWRLETIAADLVDELAHKPELRLRVAAEAVAVAALHATDIQDERIDQALAALRAGEYGDAVKRKAVKALADELDEAAWDIQEQVDTGDAYQHEYLAAFRRARAVTSLWFALDDDPMVAAMEAAYEARAAADDGLVRREIASAM